MPVIDVLTEVFPALEPVYLLPRGASGVRASLNLARLCPDFYRIEIQILVDNHDGEGWTSLGKCERLPGPFQTDRHGTPITVMTCEVRFQEAGGAEGTESIQAAVTLDGIPCITDITVEAL